VTRIEPTGRPRRGLRGAWWIALAVGLFFVAVAILQLGEVQRSRQAPRVGDGVNPETYGYDLASLTVARRWLAATMPKDNLASLDTPPLLRPAQVDSLNRAERGKYLVPDDLVIGVALGGVARAYPLRVLDWHEVANDTLAGVPIAVAWHPLSGTAVVLDRRHRGRVVELAVSGLIWNSHHLLHDRPPATPGETAEQASQHETLWLPAWAEAVAGPAAGDTLAIIPAALVRWERWRAAHPETTVPDPALDRRQAYKRSPYGSYASSDVLRYPVAPLPSLPEDQRLKDTLAIGVRAAGRAGGVAVESAGELPRATLHAYRFAVQALGLVERHGADAVPAPLD
jgi:hypothetical protein